MSATDPAFGADQVVLLSDLGGTNARFELHRISCHGEDELESQLICRASYPTVPRGAVAGSGSGFEALVRQFLDEHCAEHCAPDLCVMGVCGPVTEGAAYCASQRMMETTGPWRFTEASVSEAAGGAPTILMNDFVAVGHALSSIPAERVHCIHEPDTTPKEPHKQTVACLGPGTGLGNVYSVWDEGLGRRKVMASEGCMSSFVPRAHIQWHYFKWLVAKEGYVPVDRVVSGQGIASWYEFLAHTELGTQHLKELRVCTEPDPNIDEAVARSEQPAGVVALYGTPGEPGADPVCCVAIDCFLETLGQEAANLGMRFLALGGVFIAGGGIAAKLFNRIKDGKVRQAYLDQGVATDVIQAVPLYVSDWEDMGMQGVLAAAKVAVGHHLQVAP